MTTKTLNSTDGKPITLDVTDNVTSVTLDGTTVRISLKRGARLANQIASLRTPGEAIAEFGENDSTIVILITEYGHSLLVNVSDTDNASTTINDETLTQFGSFIAENIK